MDKPKGMTIKEIAEAVIKELEEKGASLTFS